MKPIAILQHDPLQRPGYLLQFLDELAIPARVICPCEGDDLPRSSRFFSGVVSLGSDASANDDAAWMARALGATVHRNAFANIGWNSLRITPAGHLIFGDAPQVHAFNWHYESFTIPAKATRTLFGEH